MDGAQLIARERLRQLAGEGYTPEHDDAHTNGELAWAAVCYAAPQRVYREERFARGPAFVDPWPWLNVEDKRKDRANHPNVIPITGDARVQMLVRAGALIAAEIDRLQRFRAAGN